MARANKDSQGWFCLKLETHAQKRGQPLPGRICLFAEEIPSAKEDVYFSSRATGLHSTDLFKRKCDPYFVVNRIDGVTETGEVVLTPIYRSDVCRRTSDPHFGQTSRLSAAQTCSNQLKQDIIITFHDWFRLGDDKYIGECVMDFQELQKAAARGAPLTLPICRRDGPRIMGLTRVKTTAAQLRSMTKGRSASGSLSRSGTTTGSRKSTKGSGGSGSDKPSKDKATDIPKSRRSASLGSSASAGSDTESAHVRLGSKTSASTFGSQGTSFTARSKHSTDTSGNFGPVVGHFILEEFGMIRSNSFLDYVRGGLEVRMTIAIDFTRSNGGPTNPASHHSTAHQADDSAYASVIRSLGEVIQKYDTDNMFPVYGFGAKIPPSYSVCSNCFALTGDFFEPEVEGIDGILKAYSRALQVVHFHGPSQLAEVIRLGANLARPYIHKEQMDPRAPPAEQKYFVLLVLTDGGIEDHEQVTREIKACANLPISIIFVGVGKGDFSFFRELAGTIKSITKSSIASTATEESVDLHGRPIPGSDMRREIVRFVAFRDYFDEPEELAVATLADLPQEVVGYYAAHGAKPLGLKQFEDAQGNPIPKTIPKEPISRQERVVKRVAKPPSESGDESSRSRASTNLSGSKSPAGSKSPGGSARSGGSKSSFSSSATSMLRLSNVSEPSTDEEEEDPGWDEEQQQEEELARRKEKREQAIANLPLFLKQERERLIQDATALGYEKSAIIRALRDGLPSPSLDVLVDNIIYGGWGKSPSYKDAAKAAISDPLDDMDAGMEMSLPGQVVEQEPGKMSSVMGAGAAARSKSSQLQKDFSAELNVLAKRSATQDSLTSSRLGLLASTRRSMMEVPEVEKDPWENVKIEDGSAARTLLEVSASRSREASKELWNPSAFSKNATTKTLEEVAGRLGHLRSRTLSKDRRPSLSNTVQFHTITEDEHGIEEETLTLPIGPRAAGSLDPFDMAKTMPEGAPWKMVASTPKSPRIGESHKEFEGVLWRGTQRTADMSSTL